MSREVFGGSMSTLSLDLIEKSLTYMAVSFDILRIFWNIGEGRGLTSELSSPDNGSRVERGGRFHVRETHVPSHLQQPMFLPNILGGDPLRITILCSMLKKFYVSNSI